ncbi:MAG TPA: NAD(P)-dependent oxidoreductase [Verrucomicrobiales bacterium]|nr:NAD(P)-dependent oxidoreductase [Verrucomicrobiales bacterium]
MGSGEEVAPATLAELHERASRPDPRTTEALKGFPGPVLVLGAGGKMGFHLTRALQRAADGEYQRVLAVSRFGSPESEAPFLEAGIETARCDLEDESQLAELPDAALVFYLAGIKFGTTGRPDLLRRFNVEMPRVAASRFRGSTLVTLSSGCVYPFAAVDGPGSRESDPPDPPGDYARSCLGREEAFCEGARRWGTPCVLIRLNYSVDLRYGVLVDIGRKVWANEPVDVSTGWVNAIWQGDAVNMIIRSALWAARPPDILNVTGPSKISVREAALEFGRLFGKPAIIVGRERETAWLGDASKMRERLGAPEVSNALLIRWVASWLKQGGEILDKPTRFEVRDGDF